MHTLAKAADKAAILSRLARLTPDHPRQWGRMSAHQAVCHLSDSFLAVMGFRDVSHAPTWFNKTIARFVALHTSVPWPQGVPTRPEVDQAIGGTKPTEFDLDVRALAVIVERFAASPRDFDSHPHPGFGALSEREWMTWDYKHMDHHLRQFGV